MKRKNYLSPETESRALETRQLICLSVGASSTDTFTLEEDETDNLF